MDETLVRVVAMARRYGMALVFTALAVLVRFALDPVLLDRSGSTLFALAVLASAVFGGLGPSILSAIVSGILVAYFWIEPRYELALSPHYWIDLTTYLVLAVAIGVVTESLKRLRRRELEQKQQAIATQNELRRSEARFSGFMEHLTGAAWIRNLEGRCIYANHTARTLLPRADGDTDSESIGGRLSPEEARQLEAFDEKVLTTGEAQQGLFHVEQFGETRHLLMSKFPILDADGRIMLIGGLAFDVTDRERAVRTLNTETAFRRAIEASLSSGILAVDLTGTVSYTNPAFCNLVGWTTEEVVGVTPPYPWWPPEEVDTILARFRDTVNGYISEEGYEFKFQRKDGTRFDVWVALAPLHGTDGELWGHVAAITDITARKDTERRLQALAATLEQRVAERTAMAERRASQLRILNAELVQTERRERRRLAQLLHDHLQQLLVAAKMKTALAAHQLGEAPQAQIIRDAEALLGKAITASRTLTFELSPPILDQGLVPGLRWLAQAMEEKYHLHIALQLDETAEPLAGTIRLQLFEIVRELLFNVLKHANTSDACVRSCKDNANIQIVVEDRGVGFDASTTAKPDHKHFGLRSVRERLEAIDGSLHIDSAPGRGTRITVTAPMAVDLGIAPQPPGIAVSP